MPTYKQGNMWSAHPKNGGDADLFCITTNSFIRNDGSLVMGAGIAKQARNRIPGLAQNAGTKIEATCGHLGVYGLLTPDNAGSCLALFQVKRHWKNKADTDLITEAATGLTQWIRRRPSGRKVHLNFPGIGNGGLEKDEVIPIIDPWPSNVHVWTYGSP